MPPPDTQARAAFFQSTVARPEIASVLRCGMLAWKWPLVFHLTMSDLCQPFLHSESEVAALAAASEGMSGSDLAAACRDAACAPVRELLAAVQAGTLAMCDLAVAPVRPVACADFHFAVKRTRSIVE